MRIGFIRPRQAGYLALSIAIAFGSQLAAFGAVQAEADSVPANTRPADAPFANVVTGERISFEEQRGTIDDTVNAGDKSGDKQTSDDSLRNNEDEQTPREPLSGSVQQTERLGDEPSIQIKGDSIKIDGTTQNVDLAELLRNANSLMKLLVGKSSMNPVLDLGKQKPMLSPEEYRKMEYGVIGLDALLPVNGSCPIITRILKGTPAEEAGLQKGDLIVKARNHVFKAGEGQRVLWQVVAGKAGTPVDMTVLRNGELVKVTMNRMNIEDIQDKKSRHQYRCLLNALGPPHYTHDGDLAASTIKDKEDLDRYGKSLGFNMQPADDDE